MTMSSLEEWASTELQVLGLPDATDIVRYLQPLDSLAEVEEYLMSMLDPNQASHLKFIEEFLRRQANSKVREQKDSLIQFTTQDILPGPEIKVYCKPSLEEVNGRAESKKKPKHTKNNESKAHQTDSPYAVNQSVTQIQPTPPSGKKKSKFLPLYSAEGQNKEVVLLPGRHKCDCQASKHSLVGNCMKCGRIVCKQEGSGPCVFCNNLVVSREEKEILSRGSKKSEALQKKLMNEKNIYVSDPFVNPDMSESLTIAVEQKNRLLEFDKTSEKRTQVFDDQSDYFSTNSKWLSAKDRAKLQAREEELRQRRFERSNKITIDLLGRQIIADKSDSAIYNPDDPTVKEILEGSSDDIFCDGGQEKDRRVLPNASRPIYISDSFQHQTGSSCSTAFGVENRLQDRELQEMRDIGVSLSMHQPYASLLIAGIKLHEGRMWYTSHRGRLWIASASKVASSTDIACVEQTYRVLYNDDSLKFPQHYPSGCLLGYVDVIDVLPQEEYRIQFPEGESESPFVFICENPLELTIKFPVKGQHKIYKLDTKIHQAAKKISRNSGIKH